MARKRKESNKHLQEEREKEFWLFVYQNEDQGIHCEQYNEYHYRLFCKGDIVDIWPISKKFYSRTMSASEVYETPDDIGDFLIGQMSNQEFMRKQVKTVKSTPKGSR